MNFETAYLILQQVELNKGDLTKAVNSINKGKKKSDKINADDFLNYLKTDDELAGKYADIINSKINVDLTFKPKQKKEEVKITDEVFDSVLSEIIGGTPTYIVCQMQGFPSKTQFYKFLGDDSNEKYREKYARAKKLASIAKFDEIEEIADTEEDAQIARVKIDAKKWLLSKTEPKVYGDKLDLSGEVKSTAPVIIMNSYNPFDDE